MSSIPHLVQYQGSKRNLAVQILEYMPSKFDRLVEPFAGSVAITLACASGNKSKKYVINDLNKPLIELLKLIVAEPQSVAQKYREIWAGQHSDSIAHYYQMRKKFNLTGEPTLFLYLLARCVKGAIRYNTDGFFNQSPDRRRKGTSPAKMGKNIFEISALLKGKTTFFSLDYKPILDTVMPGDIVYMDPPYQGVCGDRDSRYFSGIAHNEFVGTLEKLANRRISFIVSYDGKCGNKTYGSSIPLDIGVKHIQLYAGRSSQATLLGRNEMTYESLYVSNDLADSMRKDKSNGNELFAGIS
jgi:DNA adenine methylase